MPRDVDRINCATIAAATLVIANVERILRDTSSPLKKIRADLAPLFGIQWNKQVICGLTANRFNDLLKFLRGRGLDSQTYNQLTTLWQDAFTVSTSHPPEWLLWAPLIQSFRLQDRFSWPALYASLPLLQQKGYSSPENLATLPAMTFETTFSGTDRLTETRALWGSARALFSKQANGDFLPSSALFFASDTFVKAVHAASKRAKTDNLALAHDIDPFDLKPTFNKMGPVAKITSLRKRNFPSRKLSHLITEWTQPNLLKQIKGSFPSIASAIRCYTSFCELVSAHPFPPTEERVIRWSCVFNDTATYRNYIGHLRSACFFYRLDTSWMPPAVCHIARGLSKCQNKSFRFPNLSAAPSYFGSSSSKASLPNSPDGLLIIFISPTLSLRNLDATPRFLHGPNRVPYPAARQSADQIGHLGRPPLPGDEI